MKRIGLIALALVLSLGLMGAALAYWNETLTIEGTVAMGELDVKFSEQWSNDPPPDGPGGSFEPADGVDGLGRKGNPTDGYYDPCCCGVWDWTGWPASPPVWGDCYKDYNVGSIDCELIFVADPDDPNNDGDNLLTITMTNVYPSYCGNIAFTIDNIGTLPAKIQSVKLVEVSKGGSPTGTPDYDLVACEWVYVDADSGSVGPDINGTTDFGIHLSELLVDQIVPVDGALPGDICIHVEEGAEELSNYDFTIKIVLTQFNDVAP